MDKIQVKNLISSTFESSFNKNNFTIFIKNLLNYIDLAPFIYQGNFIPDAFKPYINSLERIGKYYENDHEIDILIVRLKKTSSIERARTMQRNFIAWYLNGSRGRKLKDAALAAFISPDEEDWRFSLIKMDYRLEQTKAGGSRLKEEFTPARRWSFLVGINEKSHTAQSRLAPILADVDNRPTLKQLEEAFNIEKVTKEFFEKYRDLFYRTTDELDRIKEKDHRVRYDFENKKINTVDFAKKLLGQIVFLYFLQKKGWFGVHINEDWGTGSRSFLRNLFEKKHSNYENFYNDILEPLFYEALRQNRSHDDDYYSKFNCKIPFLNGGLFDPLNDYDWVHTDINLPNELFSNRNITKEGDKGDGILDIFDRYNFTVNEDEPLEKEVAIDPEMLGKVFENLLEVKDRKSKGTYYTPREIVHYMCQQSLINYLATELSSSVNAGSETMKQSLPTIEEIATLIKYGEQVSENEAAVEIKEKETERYYYKIPENIRKTAKIIDEKLASIKICDPAIGSGAFPVGMMSEIVRTRNVLTTYINDPERTIYNFKRECIEKSLYGVDVDPGAVEIAKLRLWLSLIVDEEDIKQIRPLPNLDYKIMQGNSLIEMITREHISTSTDYERTKLVNEFKNLKGELFNSTSPSQKSIKRREIEILIKRIINYDRNKEIEGLKKKKLSIQSQLMLFKDKKLEKKIEETIKEIDNNIEELLNRAKPSPRDPFEWHINFSEVFQEKGGFDVVIVNPPYVGEKGHKEIFREVKKGSLGMFYLGKMDYFYFFFHLSLNIAREKASIAFITTNYYPTAMGAKKLRQDFKERGIIKNLMNFNELKIFESALGQHNMITILQKMQDETEAAQTCITQKQGIANSEALQQILNGKDTETHYYKIIQKDLYDGDEYYIRLGGQESNENINPLQTILAKIKNQGQCLGVLCNVNNGVFTGADKLNENKKNKYKINDTQVDEGIFVLTNDEVKNLRLLKNEKGLIKPLFKNSDIKKYYTKTKNELNLINLRYTDRPDINDYPNIKNHLLKFKKLLVDRPRTGTLESALNSGYWYAMSTSRKLDFDAPKIVFPQRSNVNTFGYNEITWYASADVYFITEKDKSASLKYLCALLNSKLYYIWLYYRGKRKGEMLELYQKPLSEIPIKKISESEQQPFIALVNHILAITKDEDYLQNSAKQVKVCEYEKQIDQMVYNLYNLTPEEIKVVENSGTKNN